MVSIVIPVYNPGEALKRCIESVLNQSYQNIEVILVNDGSTDTSGLICRKYSAKDRRIVYIEQTNAGVSVARNNGIAIASGEFISFIDSDDYVDVDYIECMIKAVKKSKADIVIQGLKSFRNGVLEKTEQFESASLYVSSLSEAVFDKIFYYCGPYCKLFKSAIIKKYDIRFPVDLAYGEDAVFYYEYLSHCEIIDVLNDTSYNYIIANQNSLSTRTLHPAEFWQNQHNRRGEYRRLKKVFGLPLTISPEEQFCKLTGIGGMLSSIFKTTDNDILVNGYLQIMNDDDNFNLNEVKPTNLKQRLVIKLILINNKLSRTILKILYR